MKKNYSSFIIIILSIIVVGLIGYITYDKLINDDDYNKTSDVKNESKEDNTNDIIVQNEELIKEIQPVFDFVYDYFDTSNAYCGERGGYDDYITMSKNPTTGNPTNGFFGSRQFKSYQDMIDYLKKYMTEDVIYQKVSKEHYVEQDGKLYCEDFGKGGSIYKLENINLQINNLNSDSINSTVVVELSDGDWNIIYKTYDVTFVKLDDSWIVNSFKKQD